MMFGGAVLNASAFIGGSYLVKYLSGNKTDTEKIRHDKALEKYQRDYAEYQEKRQKLIDWKIKKKDEKYQASKNISKTNEQFALYSQMQPMESGRASLEEPKFSDYYRPSNNQKMGEMAYVGGGMLALGYMASKLF